MSFKEHTSDEEMGTECEVRREWSSAGFLTNANKEEDESIFLGNFGEEAVESNINDSRWYEEGSGVKANEFWELKLSISLP